MTTITRRIALAGCGVVGGSLLRLLRERAPYLEARLGVHFEIARVLVRDRARPRALALPRHLLTSDPDEFLSTDADIVVEAIGGLRPAREIARATLRAGRDLVTANKALLALHGAELARLAAQTGAHLEFEAAVGGGTPIVALLRDSLAESGVESVRGILNGTSNYILTRISEGKRYADALGEAQRAGFAEADPTRDLDGTDAADKIRILAWLAFGADPAKIEVDRRGILPEPDRLTSTARSGRVFRMVAECTHIDGLVRARVRPVLVEPGSEWGRTRDEENLIMVETRWNGTIKVAGPGAGGPPTASALLGDIVRATRRRIAKAGAATTDTVVAGASTAAATPRPVRAYA
jgi:homoserine dehydrogenase